MAKDPRVGITGGGGRITAGARKAAAKATPQKVGRHAGSVNISAKGKMSEYMSGAKVAGKAGKVKDTAQRAELQAKGVSKRKSLPKYDKMEKHPLIRNAGEPAAEGKYRANRGKSVPVKRKSK